MTDEAQKQSDHDLLIAMNTKLDTLCKSFEKVSNGEGFNRCVKRAEQIKTLFKYKDTSESHTIWLQRTLYGSLILAFATAFVSTII